MPSFAANTDALSHPIRPIRCRSCGNTGILKRSLIIAAARRRKRSLGSPIVGSQDLAEDTPKLGHFKGLLQKRCGRFKPDYVHGRVARVTGHEDDLDTGPKRRDLCGELPPPHLWHYDIAEQQVNGTGMFARNIDGL